MRSSDRTPRDRRVLYLITNDISARFLRGQLGFLIDRGFEVGVGTRLSEPRALFDEGVVVYDVPFVREPSPIADARALAAAIALIRRTRPDIVNASTPKAGLLGMIAAWLCRVPRRVYVVRGLRFETMSGLRRQTFRWMERLATACATDVVYNSASLLAIAEGEGAVRSGRGTVLGAGSGNGIDVGRYDELTDRATARRALGIDPEATVIGYVGRLTRDKGIVDLIDAFEAATDPGILLLVGDFEDGDPLPAAIRGQIESSERVVHVPWIDDTRTVYPAMDVLAFPSYREGLPNVPLEAQLCRVPVVAYAATGTIDAIEHGTGGLLHAVGDGRALVNTSLAVAHDLAKAEALGVAGRDWVIERFDQHTVWSNLAHLYGTAS